MTIRNTTTHAEDYSCGECGHPYKVGDETHYPECSRIQTATQCEHSRVLAYTEDGQRFHGCRDCGAIVPVSDTTTQPAPAASERWQVSGYAESNRSDGQRVVRITIPHLDGGGQDVAEVLESHAPLVIAAVNHHEALVGALRDELEAIRVWQSQPGYEWRVGSDMREGLGISATKISAALATIRQPAVVR